MEKATDDRVNKILAFETDTMPEDQIVAFFQEMIDDGMVWNLQGAYGRLATALIESGRCHPAEKAQQQENTNLDASKNS